MNQEKIGKLIAKLRKEKGLTQSDLGAKVGVGFKAVSKWERGITCPDISIINELSKILGITSDELLSGELNEEHRSLYKKDSTFNKKLLLLIIPIILIIASIIVVINKNKDNVYIYNLMSANEDAVYIEGNLTFEGNKISICITKLNFNDATFNETVIKNYQYEIISNNVVINKYGFVPVIELLDEEKSIKDFTSTFNINYNNVIELSREKIANDNLILRITFLDIDENIIEKEMILSVNKNGK